MSSRPGILVTHRFPFESDPPPNRTRDLITVEIRVHWPHSATMDTVGPLLTACYLEAIETAAAKMAEPAHRNEWLRPPESTTRPPAGNP